ncbi:MAG TPA: hypothetical protein VNO34_05970 [Actinomycetota bacterium]|nr:hypothetical protein [Actinomycetota bacterium]
MIGGVHPSLAAWPLAAAVIAGAFAAVLGRRFADRRRPHEGLWCVALLMYALASLAMFLGVLDGWSGVEYRVYWLLGAVLNVPFLFAGEVYLLTPRRGVGHAALGVLLLATAWAAWVVATAPLHHGELGRTFPLGREVFGAGSGPHRLAQYYSFPAYFLLLGALLWSAFTMRGRPELRARTGGVLAIALGATVVAIGSGVGAGFRVVPLFAASLAVGAALMFWGFLLATRAPAPAPRPAGGPS